MDNLISTIYHRRYEAGIYDEYPEAKRLVFLYLHLSPEEKKESLTWREDERFNFGSMPLKTLQSFLRDPPDNPIFYEDSFVVPLYQGLLRFYEEHYDEKTGKYGMFAYDSIFRQWLIEVFVRGHTEFLNFYEEPHSVETKQFHRLAEALTYREGDLPFTEEDSILYFRLLGYINRFMFRSLSPSDGVGGSLGIEIALGIPYLDEINRLGFRTVESSELHIEYYYKGEYVHQTPWVVGDIPTGAIPYLQKIPYTRFFRVGSKLPRIAPSHIHLGKGGMAPGYTQIYFETIPEEYDKLVLMEEDPFYEDIIEALNRYWDDRDRDTADERLYNLTPQELEVL